MQSLARLVGVSISLCMLVCSVAATVAQAQDDGGAALWAAYSSLLLDAAADHPELEFPPVDPVALDALEGRFAADPRYWQLRCFEAQRADYGTRYEERPVEQIAEDGSWAYYTVDPTPQALDWLRAGLARDVYDDATRYMLYAADREAFTSLWNRYSMGKATDEDLAALPQFGPADVPSNWFDEREYSEARALAESMPDEAWPWYELAMLDFRFGDWDEAMAHLQRGNSAPRSRMLHIFPYSYLIEQAAAGREPAPARAAGMAFEFGLLAEEPPNFIRMKDHFKEAQLRLAMGAGFDEAATLFDFACRLGSMEGASPVQWLVGVVLCNMVSTYALIETGDSFEAEQRREIWALYHRTNRVRDMVRFKMQQAQAEAAGHQELGSLSREARWDYYARDLRLTHAELAATARQHFAVAAQFDFAQWAFPPGVNDPLMPTEAQ